MAASGSDIGSNATSFNPTLNVDFTTEERHVLNRLGVPATTLPTDDEARKKLKKILADLYILLNQLETDKKKVSNHTLINWAAVLFQQENSEIDSVMQGANYVLNKSTQQLDSAMKWTYLGLNFIGLLLSVAAMQNFNAGFLADDTVNTVSGSGWNYLDTIGGVATGISQIYRGEAGIGIANIVASMQLAGCTIAANIAKYTTLIQASAAQMCALMGFSFAACMIVSCCIELYEAYKSNERIKQLESKSGVTEEEKLAIKKGIEIESTQYRNHIRSAKSWAGCAVGMTAVAVISYAALSGLTFGALPVATIVIAAAAFLSGVVRTWWVGRNTNGFFNKKLPTQGNSRRVSNVSESPILSNSIIAQAV